MTPQTSREAFLSNSYNKSRLISFLQPLLHKYEIITNQAEEDADYLIAKITLQLSRNESTLCLAKDTDILAMLVEGLTNILNYTLDPLENHVTMYEPCIFHYLLTLENF